MALTSHIGVCPEGEAMRILRVRVLAVAIAGVVLVTGWLGASAAQADPVSVWEIAARQEQIRPAKIAILEQSSDWVGYAGMRTDPAERTIYVRWKGDISAQAREFLNELSGARIRVERVPFTEAELAAEALRLVNSGAARAAGPAKDLGGLSVAPAVGARGIPATEYPVTILPDAAVPEPMGRQDDGGAWHGGARAKHPNGYCTLGFGYRDANGVYTSTSNHCAYANNVAWTDGADDWIGRSQRSRYQDDATLIKAGSVGVSAYILHGPWNSTSRPSRPVRGEGAQPMQGDFLCQSGSVSGEICGLRVGATSFVWSWRPGESTVGMVAEQTIAGVQAVARGDSGGPVYEMWHSTPDVWALGMTSGGIIDVPCSTNGTQPGATCFDQIWVTYVRHIIQSRGLSLVTV